MSSTASGWEARPKGWVLEEDSIVGTIEEGRAVVATLQAQEATIEIQASAIQDLKASLTAISADLYDARQELALVPETLSRWEAKMNASLDAAKEAGRSQGHKEAVVLGGALAVIGTIVGIMVR